MDTSNAPMLNLSAAPASPPPAEAAPRAGGDDVLGEDGSLGR